MEGLRWMGREGSKAFAGWKVDRGKMDGRESLRGAVGLKWTVKGLGGRSNNGRAVSFF